VICTRDRPNELATSITAVRAGVIQPHEIIVVDNAPLAPVRDIAVRLGARYEIELVIGLSRARNVGWRVADGDVVAYLDDDAVPDPGWLGALLEPFNAQADIVTGRCTPLAESATPELQELISPWWMQATIPFTVTSSTPGWESLAITGALGTGTNMAFRRGLLDGWKGFDERLGLGAPIGSFEEHEAFFALIARGARLAYAPDALVRHPAIQSPDAFAQFRASTRAAYVGYLLHLLAKYPRHRAAILKSMWGQFAHGPADKGPGRRTMFSIGRAAIAGAGSFIRSRR
jgi:glycosyltransferase involved in cell wall biosynthesis